MEKRPLVAATKGVKAARRGGRLANRKAHLKALAKRYPRSVDLYNPESNARGEEYLKHGLPSELRKQIANEERWLKPSRETLLQIKMTF